MDKPKQMIVVRRDLKMRKGKIAAQAGHACVTAVLAALERQRRRAGGGAAGGAGLPAGLKKGGPRNFLRPLGDCR